MRLLIIGCGYVGKALGSAMAQSGHRVWGLRRSAGEEDELRSKGITPIQGDITNSGFFTGLSQAFDWVVNCVSAGRGAGPDGYRAVYLDGTIHLLDWLRRNPCRKLVYTSSTGVYGQSEGKWIDENSPTQPQSLTGQILVETERRLLEAVEHGVPAVILRSAGIYGPGRGYWFRLFMDGAKTIAASGARMINQIHRDDLVRAIGRCLEDGRPGQVYNAVDDAPTSLQEFYRWLADATGQSAPSFTEGGGVAPSKRRGGDKRIRNHKLKNDLGLTLLYPSYREGYRAEIRRYLAQRARTE